VKVPSSRSSSTKIKKKKKKKNLALRERRKLCISHDVLYHAIIITLASQHLSQEGLFCTDTQWKTGKPVFHRDIEGYCLYLLTGTGERVAGVFLSDFSLPEAGNDSHPFSLLTGQI
jgi:hypothetical protein